MPTMSKRTALITARRAKSLSQLELGALVGMSQSGIARIEGGEFVPTADIARALMSVLGVSLDDVIGVDESEPTEKAVA